MVRIVAALVLVATIVAGCGRVDQSNPNWPDWCLWIAGIGGCL